MKQFLLTIAGVFVGLLLFLVVVPVMLVGLAISSAKPTPISGRTVLTLDLRSGLTDQEPQSGLAIFSNSGVSVMGIEDGLRRAAADSHVGGLFVRLPDAGMSPAAADELRLAFQAFRASGKPILAFSQGLYAEGVPTATYELAAASGNFWMQPSSSFQAVGLAQEDIFFKNFFDRYGVVADYQQRYEYKNAVNGYLYSDYTQPHREATLSWMGSVYATSLQAAATDRKMTPDALKAILEAGPYAAEDAKAKGLVDTVGELRDAQAAILKAAGDGAKFTDFSDYMNRTHGQNTSLGAPTIALIQVEGDIVTGTGAHGGGNPFGGSQNIYSDDVAQAFYNAIDDKDVKAIVFRVSSPGGSDTASEEILSAVLAAKAAGKPVVVSMGDYGASGGYWISSQANEIVAEPSTLTGSIGVFGGKLAIGPALARFGIDIHGLSVGGDYAGAFGAEGPMTPTQRAAFSAWMDKIYQGFVTRVAQGRRLPLDRVMQIAKGHVWTGAQARDLGLVDQVGGYQVALQRAEALAGLHGDVRVKPFSTTQSPFAALLRLFGGGADADSAARLLLGTNDVSRDPVTRDLLETLHQAHLRAEGATVLAPIMPFGGR